MEEQRKYKYDVEIIAYNKQKYDYRQAANEFVSLFKNEQAVVKMFDNVSFSLGITPRILN
jgi:hypothetical protein